MTIKFVNAKDVQYHRNSRKEPTINVQRNGRINFNKSFVDEYIKDNQFVLLGYNEKDKNKIYIKSAKENESGEAFPIRVISKTKSHYVTATGFFREAEINLDDIRGTHLAILNKDDLIEVNLTKEKNEKPKQTKGKTKETEKKTKA